MTAACTSLKGIRPVQARVNTEREVIRVRAANAFQYMGIDLGINYNDPVNTVFFEPNRIYARSQEQSSHMMHDHVAARSLRF
jgi:hypothetical protein